jgi:hypothetical protein
MYGDELHGENGLDDVYIVCVVWKVEGERIGGGVGVLARLSPSKVSVFDENGAVR